MVKVSSLLDIVKEKCTKLRYLALAAPYCLLTATMIRLSSLFQVHPILNVALHESDHLYIVRLHKYELQLTTFRQGTNAMIILCLRVLFM